MLRNTFLVSASRSDRDYRLYSYALPSPTLRIDYLGDRLSAEYQGDLKLGTFGLLTFGAKANGRNLFPRLAPCYHRDACTDTVDATQMTRSLFALHQFACWRTFISRSAAGSMLSPMGTPSPLGARLPLTRSRAPARTAHEPRNGRQGSDAFSEIRSLLWHADLESENSIGFDVGMDQRLADDRAPLATFFANRFGNLIGYGLADSCRPSRPSAASST